MWHVFPPELSSDFDRPLPAIQAQVRMMSAVTKTLIPILSTTLALCLNASAQCPVNTVIVKGRVVENPNAHSKVRVQLVYPKQKPGESAEATVEDGAFQMPVEFVTTQSSIFSNLPTRCSRKPKTVIITLLKNDQQSDQAPDQASPDQEPLDQVFLDFATKFKMSDASAYTVRSEVVLKDPR
jgi:hypothetical protein